METPHHVEAGQSHHDDGGAHLPDEAALAEVMVLTRVRNLPRDALIFDHGDPADAVTIAESLEASWREVGLLDLINRHPRIAMNVIRRSCGSRRIRKTDTHVRFVRRQTQSRPVDLVYVH